MYSISKPIESAKKVLSQDFRVIENWFQENLVVLNANKCRCTCFEIGIENDDVIFDGIKLPNGCEGKN